MIQRYFSLGHFIENLGFREKNDLVSNLSCAISKLILVNYLIPLSLSFLLCKLRII